MNKNFIGLFSILKDYDLLQKRIGPILFQKCLNLYKIKKRKSNKFLINFSCLCILQWIYHSLQLWTWFSFEQFLDHFNISIFVWCPTLYLAASLFNY